MSDLSDAAKELYTPPFSYHHGYIWDANDNMVADNHHQDVDSAAALRVRGWGRIQYMDNPEDLQDAVGQRIAEILTEHWLDGIPTPPGEK